MLNFRLMDLPSEVRFIASKNIYINSNMDKQEIISIVNNMVRMVKTPVKKQKRKAL